MCRENGGHKKEKTAEEARIAVSVSEINCTVCATAIQKQVMKTSGVKRVKPAIMPKKGSHRL